MSRFYILVRCPFCPCFFNIVSPTPMTGPMYHLQGITFCPHCKTRIVGQRGTRPGIELEIIPMNEEQEEWFKTGKRPEMKSVGVALMTVDQVSAELEKMRQRIRAIFSEETEE